ncbi:phage tail protein [Novosphingobium album (ex Liu et al. 2023)]|uniref:Phage tail protein n=1 Tax=Novosphingobium album (ex Liu et al. 2023) TaxID=3031130 RepID=A0ABT5WM99_9SPHN|nr:phage tail protein [Novosphingobium album (ex Liu et al. 2023)]MDE8650816.1 phage tail protein [Novosphingobium album (ex Liu et al. 2023)]
MATLVFGAIGTALGGPLGGAIGALLGRQVDTLVFGSPNTRGPRLKELEVTTSSYGTPLPRHFGRMRVPGSLIWATELTESSDTQGGGKSQPSVTTYSYTASFAVALASRPIQGIGRIWADGRLLRGEAGDLKVPGSLRLYTGERDQEPDPLIAADVGPDRCPAYRGLAYVVFEALDLAEFYNHLPALTFEVIADDTVSLAQVVGEVIADCDAAVSLDGLAGLTCEGPVAETLELLDPLFPLDADAGGALLTIARARLQGEPIALPEPAVAVADDAFGGAAGFSRRRLPQADPAPAVLRYYDRDRDYQPGLQRAAIRPSPGQPRTIELPAAMNADAARSLIERTARKLDWSRDRIAWRMAALDSAIAPGACVTLPDRAGTWRVLDWEWRETGVELSLARIAPTGADAAPGGAADPGQHNPPADLAAPPTSLLAFELPWTGNGSGDAPSPFAALSSPGANWSGAALYRDNGDGALLPLGPGGRTRSAIGTATSTLPAAHPLLFDRHSTLTVQLVASDLDLINASTRQLALGANLALVGDELVQFAQAIPLGEGRWRLGAFLRGRAGTEGAVAGHGAGEPFALLDGRPLPLDPARVGTVPDASIVAVGLGDAEPVEAAIRLRGISVQPLCPVHPRARMLPDGTLRLSWTRRARGAWQWIDMVDVPLHEEFERYRIDFGPSETPLATWVASEARLDIPAATLAGLAALLPGGSLCVRQEGTHALSPPLLLASLG